jgi:RNA polymerase sigma-70 factor (ECF subfamily)
MARDDPTDEDLQRLLDRLAAGDKSAADQLVERSVGRMHSLAHSMLRKYPRVRRWYETGDVSQAAAMRLRQALMSRTPPSPKDFLQWAAVQIRRELYDLLRHEYGPEGPGAHHATGPPGQSALTEGNQRPKAVDSEAEHAIQTQWADLLRHLQDALPFAEREVFDLLYVMELSQEEAAQLLGVSVPTVKRRWRSARLLLGQILGG